MREPENRRGVSLRAGVGIATVAATVVAGIALANPASAAVGDIAHITQTPATATTNVGVTNTFDVTATDINNQPAVGQTVDVIVSMPVPTGATGGVGSSPFTTSPVGTDASTATTWIETATVTTDATTGKASFTVTSSKAGTATVTSAKDDAGTADPTIRANSTLTIGSANGVNGVDHLTVKPTSVTQYVASVDAAPTFDVTPIGANGAPVEGVVVGYKVTGANPSVNATAGTTTATATTLTLTPTPGTNAGTDNITFFVNNVTSTPTATATATFDAAPTPTPDTAKSTLTTPAATLPAGQATSVPFTVTVDDSTGAVVPNAVVRFDAVGSAFGVAPNNTMTKSATTDKNGQATVSFPVTAAQAADGNGFTVTAYVSEASTGGIQVGAANVPVAFAKAAAHAITSGLPGNATEETVVNHSTVSLPVAIVDQFGNAAGAGDTLSWTVTGGRNNQGPTTVTADANGKATISYTDQGTTGSDTVTVTDTTTAGVTPLVFTVDYTASVAVSKVVVSTPTTPEDASKTATQAVTATVTNAAGDPLYGVPVTFSVNIGFVGGAGVTSDTGKTTYVAYTVKSGGAAVATANVGSAQTGIQTVTATAGGVTGTAAGTVTYDHATGTNTFTLTGPTKAVAPGSSATFTAKIADSLGNGYSGETVYFTGSDASVMPGAVSPVTATTGPDGTVSITIAVPADSTSTGGTITATTPDTFVVPAPNNVASAAYTVAAPTAAKVKVATSSPLRALSVEGVYATLTDSTGARLKSGVEVQFTVTGAAHVTTTAKTNLYGVAKAYFRPSRAGSMTVTATSGGVSGSTTVTVLRAIEQPSLTAVSNSRGLAHVVVITDPKLPLVRVTIYKAQNHGYISAGTFKAGTGGRVHVNLRVRSGATVHFKARANNLHYIERYSNVDTVKVQ